MKEVIVMSYFERPFQLKRTLQSIALTRYKNFEVVIVSDTAQEKIVLPKLPYKVTVLEYQKDSVGWAGSMIAFNTGFAYALEVGAGIIIMQSAECYHVGDVLSYASKITNRDYLSFGCYSINEETTFSDHCINDVIASSNRGARSDGENAWYNHPYKRAVGYHFCSAITAKNLKLLNGFDERYMNGIAYDDDDFIYRVKLLRLKIEITEDPFVVHQWHFSGHSAIPNKQDLMEVNKTLFIALKRNASTRALHIITPNL